jgi:hypothetical protein
VLGADLVCHSHADIERVVDVLKLVELADYSSAAGTPRSTAARGWWYWRGKACVRKVGDTRAYWVNGFYIEQ